MKTIKKDLLVCKAAAKVSEDLSDAERKLTNIRTREVSLVDSAANGREFLIVKRSEDMSKKKDKTLFKGEGAEADKEPVETPETVAKTAEAEPVVEPSKESKVAPVTEDGKETEVVKAEAGPFSKLAEETLQTVPVAKALVMEQKGMFMAMADALMGMAMSMDMIRMDIMSFVGSDGKTAFMGEEVIKSLKAEIAKTEEGLTEDELTEKAGRKMKGNRLSKLKEALGTLESLVKELEGDTNVKKGGSTVSKQEEKKDQGTQKSAEVSTEKATTAETPAAETAPKEEQVMKAADVQKIVDAAVEKATAPLKEEIEALKAEPSDSAAGGADSTEDVETNKSEKQESIFKGLI